MRPAGWLALSALACAAMLFPSAARASLTIVEEDFIATLQRARLKLRIPFDCSGCDGERFVVSVKTIGGRNVARRALRLSSRHDEITHLDLVLPLGANARRAALLVLHYRYIAKERDDSDRGSISLDRILDGPRILLRGQRVLLAGSRAPVRVVVQSLKSGAPMPNTRMTATLTARGIQAQTQQGRTGPGGTYTPTFAVPESLLGQKARLKIVAVTPIGARQVTVPLKVSQRVKVLLTTDKPIYQPGQTIHLRTLALRTPAGGALAKAPLTFEIKDGRGNKVFQQEVRTDRFGIAHARFQLARRVNQGRYRVTARASVPGGKPQEAVRTVRVFRYRLPTFRIRTKLARPYFSPGEMLAGEAYIWYVFKKPVVGGQVALEATKVGAPGETPFARLKGRTDRWGAFKFRLPLPKSFAGLPLHGGQARVRLTLTIREPGGTQRSARIEVPVVEHPVRIALVPESGALVGPFAQRVFVLTALPDGSPTSAAVEVRIADKRTGAVFVSAHNRGVQKITLQTDEQGIGQLMLKPKRKNSSKNTKQVALSVAAKDRQGREGRQKITLGCERSSHPLLVRPTRALYRVGERLEVQVLAGGAYAYVDLVRGGQTLSTHEVKLAGGQGKLGVTLPPDASGVLLVSAYVFNDRGEAVRDVRPVLVHQARELRVKVQPDRRVYTPGQPASLDVAVTDARGLPVLAALGVRIIDSAVYALSESQPGLAEAFFRLEQELLKPSISVLGFSPAQLVPIEATTAARRRQARAAEVLMSAAAPGFAYSLEVDGESLRQKALRKQVSQLATPVIRTIAWRIAAAQKRDQARQRDPCGWYPLDLEEIKEKRYLRERHLTDPWGEEVSSEAEIDDQMRVVSMTVTSSGPDEEDETKDDITAKIRFVLPGRRCIRRYRYARRPSARFAPRRSRGGADLFSPFGASARARPRRPKPRFKKDSPSKARPARSAKAGAAKPTKVRRYFPEALYINPALITDAQGRAKIALKMADSITTWKLSALASTIDGQLGSIEGSLRVFTPFFVDVSLPPELTRGDRITLPVALHNHQRHAETVQVRLKPASWYRLAKGAHTISKRLEPGSVTSVPFSIEVLQVGTWRIQVTAKGRRVSDGVERLVAVRPDGDPVEFSDAGLLDRPAMAEVFVPRSAIAGSPHLTVRVAPGSLAAAVDGLEAMLRMPHGCFEQTSSTTYPNVMIQQYLAATKRASPALAARARQLIATGYQRLVSFEVPGGGFSVFGHHPPDKALSAYGLHEFVDMAQVHPVDKRLIRRTRAFLSRHQRGDGSWSPKPSYFYDDPSTIDRIRVTAYVAWAMVRAGARGEVVQKAITYLQRRLHRIKDPYTLAIIASLLAERSRRHPLLGRVLQQLLRLRKDEGASTHWPIGEGETITHSHGQAADVEATALVVGALLRSGRHLGLTRRALRFLASAKSARGGWGSTQANVLALQALLADQRTRRTKDARGTVQIALDGKPVGQIRLTATSAGLLQAVDLSEHLRLGKRQRMALKFTGKGAPMYQVSGRFHLPYGQFKRPVSAKLKLQLSVTYDKRQLSADKEALTARVVVRNSTDQAAIMPIIDIGRPAGFDPEILDLERLVRDKRIARFDILSRQIVIYLNRLKPRQTLRFRYRLRARFPLRVTVPPSRAYEYYDAERRAYARPTTVTAR